MAFQASSSKQRRVLQFVEAMIAAAEAHYNLPPAIKVIIEEGCPGLGSYLRSVSDGLAQGVCAALELERPIHARKTGRHPRWWGL
jgi:hypothetical protein